MMEATSVLNVLNSSTAIEERVRLRLRPDGNNQISRVPEASHLRGASLRGIFDEWWIVGDWIN